MENVMEEYIKLYWENAGQNKYYYGVNDLMRLEEIAMESKEASADGAVPTFSDTNQGTGGS
ncbi:MAG: hypothetical protein LBC61_04905 [Candidatus Peribacteria bacterium]|jgi:hypothetical protein|nr:hypothetical protein [Candidatus Peribacteria bacterium]